MVMKMISSVFLFGAIARVALAQPSLDTLSSIWQPMQQNVYGAPSVTNAWGSVLVSTANVLGFNALELAPFSSGWDAQELYGWPTDSASLYINGSSVPPSASLWTPYSVIRNGSASVGTAQVSVSSELRWVFEGQALLLEVNISVADGSAAAVLDVAVNFATPLRYFPRGDQCSSWHYPTHSEPCCFNWFNPEPATGEDNPAIFVPTWLPCAPASGKEGAATPVLVQQDVSSAATSAFAIAGACAPLLSSAATSKPSLSSKEVHVDNDLTRFRAAQNERAGAGVVDLGTPDAVSGTVASWSVGLGGSGPASARLRVAFAFDNSSLAFAPVAQTAQDLAAVFDVAFGAAAADWQARFDSVFDPSHAHFSGHLPLLDAGGAPMEQIYYASVVGLLANERTNMPVAFPAPADAPSCLATASDREQRATADTRAAHAPLPQKPAAAAAQPLRMFMTGGGLNATTNIFYWDNSYSSQLLALLEPATLRAQLLLWLSSVDETTGLPSYWAFWGYEYAAQRGIGNYYAANDFTLVNLVHTYVAVTGDADFLATNMSIAYANGTVLRYQTVYDVTLSMVTHWRDMNVTAEAPFLADYGLAENLLECVPTYIHRVASCNAGNVWMGNAFASVAESWANDTATATRLRADADAIAAAVLDTLYVPGAGYFAAQYPNGTLQPVMHVMDFTYVSMFLGVQNTSTNSTTAYIPPAVADEMRSFVQSELIVPHWMRALSLNDSAAPFSNRSDHGPSGAYIGWPALTIRAFGLQRRYSDALAFLADTLFSATLGPYGQAIEIRPPAAPYKPMDVTLYNAMVSGSFADTITQTFFGFKPPLVLPGMPMPPSPLMDASTPRGFNGSMKNVPWNGDLWTIVSSAETGLSITKQ